MGFMRQAHPLLWLSGIQLYFQRQLLRSQGYLVEAQSAIKHLAGKQIVIRGCSQTPDASLWLTRAFRGCESAASHICVLSKSFSYWQWVSLISTDSVSS